MATSASTAEGPYFAGHGTKPYRAFVLGMLLLVYTFNFIDRVAIDILQEQIKKAFGLLDAQLGLLKGLAFAFLYTLIGIPLARLAERAAGFVGTRYRYGGATPDGGGAQFEAADDAPTLSEKQFENLWRSSAG